MRALYGTESAIIKPSKLLAHDVFGIVGTNPGVFRLYVFYFRKLGFGLGQAIEINTYTHGPSRLPVVGVKWLSGSVAGPIATVPPARRRARTHCIGRS